MFDAVPHFANIGSMRLAGGDSGHPALC